MDTTGQIQKIDSTFIGSQYEDKLRKNLSFEDFLSGIFQKHYEFRMDTTELSIIVMVSFFETVHNSTRKTIQEQITTFKIEG